MPAKTQYVFLCTMLLVLFGVPKIVIGQFKDSTEASLSNQGINVEEAKEQCKAQVDLEVDSVCVRQVGDGQEFLYKTQEDCTEGLLQQCLKDLVEVLEAEQQQKKQVIEARGQQRTIIPSSLISEVRSLNQLQVTNISDFSNRVIRVVLSVMGTIALVMFIYGGVLWMFSQGNADKMKKATSVIVWSALGVIIIVSSYAIITFILEAFTP